ncbi:MAG TPA: bifunctional phosphopantothenoylcysteine decarboxylase/phosphopantothenate--cysteine ligase CoaBC, partial [Actinomycetota bacterium]|nr:bifunctional phosphopantothenoylcysteine decarboxylase/phosphopantothenate--cysteine ligase CoaBC [Actinomycetota bacterium]
NPPADSAESGVPFEAIQSKKVLVGVTGGIAAYKVVEVVRTLTQLGAEVHVVMTRTAQNFVGTQTFASLSGRPVATELFHGGPEAPHVELARGADLLLIAPATANAIARAAVGSADDLLSATLLMVRCPILVAPAMHTEMWEHPATQENVNTLRGRGIDIIGPATGALMSGDEGAGRMVEAEGLVAAVSTKLAQARDLLGKDILVTAGGTQEPIDAVRFIGNRSSGLMGTEIARAAQRRGAKVTLVLGPTGRPPPPGVDVIPIDTTDEMRDTVLSLAGNADVIVMAAAVSDFKPQEAASHKLKKSDGPPDVELVATPDILKELGSDPSMRPTGSILVGFAAETEADPSKLAALATKKRDSKRTDLIVANDVGSNDSGFGVRTNRAVIAGPDGITDVGLVTKTALAEALVEKVAELIERRGRG